MGNVRIAEKNDVRFQPLIVATIDGGPELRVAGLLFHSAAIVENIRLVANGRTMRILVEMLPTHAGKSGRFEATVPLPTDVQRVTFGQADAELWTREGNRLEDAPVNASA